MFTRWYFYLLFVYFRKKWMQVKKYYVNRQGKQRRLWWKTTTLYIQRGSVVTSLKRSAGVIIKGVGVVFCTNVLFWQLSPELVIQFEYHDNDAYFSFTARYSPRLDSFRHISSGFVCDATTIIDIHHFPRFFNNGHAASSPGSSTGIWFPNRYSSFVSCSRAYENMLAEFWRVKNITATVYTRFFSLM